MLHVKFRNHWTSGSGEEDLKIFTIYYHIKAEVAKFDLDVKYVKINTGLSFEQNMISLNL